ncbi:unnamed protein product [Arctogadus glacialis]
MDHRPNPAGSVSSPPAGGLLRTLRRPPPSPCPLVPDMTRDVTGLEWLEMTSCPGPSGSDQAVPGSPSVTAHSSPRCNFSVPSTPVQETWGLFLQPEDELSADYNRTFSPLGQTVPVFRE